MIRAGHCTACGVPTWKTLPHPVSGMPILLWPFPSSRYAAVSVPNGLAPGIGYCGPCAPRAGDPVGSQVKATLPDAIAIGYVDPAGVRYADWFTAAKGRFLRVWLAEEFKLDPDALLREWESARQEAQHVPA